MHWEHITEIYLLLFVIINRERFPNPDKRVIARATNIFNETESWIESCGHGRCNSNSTKENIFMNIM